MRPVPWRSTASTPPLAEGAVHLWRTATQGGLDDELVALLSAEERGRAERLRRPQERARWVAGRAAVRRVLAGYVHRAPGELAFDYGAYGKPRLRDGGRVRFSVSHAGDLLLVAVAGDREVGIDVERAREVRRWRRVAERHFSPEVREVLEAMGPTHGASAFLHAWTCLEAHAKARGGGVYATRTHLPLPWPPPLEGVLVPEGGKGAGDVPWTLRVLYPAAGFVATVAAEGEVGGWEFLEGPPPGG